MKKLPEMIYREERRNDDGDWVCSRMTYNRKLFLQWREHYADYEARFGLGSYPTGPYRYFTGTITWDTP